MIKLEVRTHSGDSDILEVELYDADEQMTKLADESNQFIQVADNIYSRIDIKSIKPVKEVKEEGFE